MYFGTAQTVFSEPKRRLANRLMLVSGGLGELLSGLLALIFLFLQNTQEPGRIVVHHGYKCIAENLERTE